MPSEAVEWCPLQDFSSGETLLKEACKASGQQIKKYDFHKSWLARAVLARDTVRLPLALVNSKEVWPLYQGPSAAVLAENDSILALHKPAGIHTHPQGYDSKANLVSWLCAHGRAPLSRVNSEGSDRGCLYRLDQETSGLVLYAKTDEVYQQMRTQFSTMMKKKLYLCVVKGDPGAARDVEHRLMPFGPKGAQMKVTPEGERGILHYQTVMNESGLSVVLVELQTGLRHQIRAQMSALGYPLLGDVLYGSERAQRMFLHCWRYQTANDTWTDPHADLFGSFFNLDRLFQVIHDKLG